MEGARTGLYHVIGFGVRRYRCGKNDETGAYICIDSAATLSRYTGRDDITDLHRDVVDDLTFTVPGEAGVYRRISEVLDCWFESGSMPYAQQHYPFADKAAF